MLGKAPQAGWSGPAIAVLPPARLLPEARFGAIEIGNGKAGRIRADIGGRSVDLMLPAGVQTVTGDGLEKLVAAPGGGAALARARDSDPYILAHPDQIGSASLREKMFQSV